MNNIEILEKLVERCKECKFACCEQCEINWKEVQAIENLIQENKKLEEKAKNTMELIGANYIHKDKIKEKIKEYNIPILDVLDKLPIPRNIEVGIGAKDGIIYVLQELLEGE